MKKLLLISFVICACIVVCTGIAKAQVFHISPTGTPYTIRYQDLVHGGVVVGGNANVRRTNNAIPSEQVDIDGDAGTFNSSSENITIPAGARVKKAFLYWQATAAGGTVSDISTPPASRPNFIRVKFKGPGGGAYTDLTPDHAWQSQTYYWQGMKDVTSLVTGSGIYTIANIDTDPLPPATNGWAPYAGWSLWIEYEYTDPTAPLYHVALTDGLNFISAGANTLVATGFRVPVTASIPVEGEVGWFVGHANAAWGDAVTYSSPTITNEFLSDPAHPENGVLDETRSYKGTVITTGRNPAFGRNYSNNLVDTVPFPWFDLSVMDLTSRLTRGQTTFTLNFYPQGNGVSGCAGYPFGCDDWDHPAYLYTAVRTEPRNTDLSVVKVGPAAVTARGPVTYKLLVSNNGPVAANGAIVVDSAVARFAAATVTCVSGSGDGGNAGCPVSPTITDLQGRGLVIPTLPSGSSVTFTITGTAGDSGIITNAASVITPTDVIDTLPANNHSVSATSISLPCNGTLTTYLLDPAATFAGAGTIGANGGTVNLVYTLASGPAIPSLGNSFTVPVTYTDFRQAFGGSDHTWNKYIAFAPTSWDGGVTTVPAFGIVPNTSSFYTALPPANRQQEAITSPNNTDNFFTTYIANGTIDQLGTFDITIGNLPALPAGVRLVSDSIRILSTNNLSTNGNGFDQGGWWVKPVAQHAVFGGGTGRTVPLRVAHGNTYTYRYSAFTDGSQMPGADRGVVIESGSVVFCTPSTPAPAFICQNATGYLTQGVPTSAYIVNLGTGDTSLAKTNLMGTAVNTEINGIGFNVKDNYIWGSRQRTNQVVRIHADWSIDTFAVPGLPVGDLYVGDVNEDGILYLFNAEPANTAIQRVDVNPSSPTFLQTLSTLPTSPSNIYDWAFSPIDGNLYALSGGDYQLLRFNATTGARTVVGVVTGDNIQVDNGNNLFGAAYMDNEGSLYVSNNTTGKIYKIANPHSGGITATFVTNGPVSATNDGARCPLTPIPVPPLAVNDTVVTEQNRPITVPILTNDTSRVDPLDPDSIVIVQPPANGSVTIDSANGAIVYTPNPGYAGPDSLVYTVKDTAGIVSNEAAVIIDIDSLPPAFTCTDSTGYLVQDDASDAYIVNLATGASTLAKADLLGATNARLNAIGYNVTDNFLWGHHNLSNEVVRIASDWTVTRYPITGMAAAADFNVGDVSFNGVLYLYLSGAATIARVNVNPRSPDYLKQLPPLNTTASTITDWAFSPVDSNLYAINNTNFQLFRFNRNTGARTALGIVNGAGIQVVPPAGTTTFGAAYMDNEGNLYVSKNETGEIFKITTPHTGGTTATLVANGPLSANNDGARCPFTAIKPTAPTAVNDTVTVDAGRPLVIDVQRNDSTLPTAAPLDSASTIITQPPAHGTATVDTTTGKVTYTSTPGFTGRDTLKYVVTDTLGIPDTATVYITIVPAQAKLNCTSAIGYLIQNNPSDMFIVNLVTGVSTLVKDDLLGATNASLNAVGYNAKDNYLWADRIGTNQLVRIGSDWSVQTFAIAGLPGANNANVGDISTNGIMYLYAGNTTTIYRVDLNPDSPDYLKTLPSLTTVASGIADWAISPVDNNLYGVDNNLQLLRFNPNTGARTVIGAVSGGGIATATGFGACYMDSDGALYLSDNATGNIYRLASPHTGNRTATFLTKGPASGSNDGARCPLTLVVSDPPLARNDTTTTPVGTPVTIPVLDNDSAGTYPINPDSIIITEQPKNGTLTIDTATNTVIYTPNPGFEGQDNFSYIIKDSTGRESSPPATVQVNTNNPPPTGGPALCATPGADGSVNAGSPVNTYFPAHLGSLASGSTSVVLDSVPAADAYGNSFGNIPIKAGDLLLIVQMQNARISGANTSAYGAGYTQSGPDTLGGTGYMSLGQSGRYEYVVATSAVPLSGGTLTFKGAGAGNGTVHAYIDSAATAARGQSTFQVIRVPQYKDLTLDSNIVTPPFNGQAGGIIAFDVAGNMNFNGFTIDGTARGFRGGYSLRAASANNINNLYARPSTSADGIKTSGKGEGIAGTPRYVWDGYNQVDNTIEGLPGGAFGKGAPATAGGGGSDHNAGGGGGANGGFGGVGGLGLAFSYGTDSITNYPNGGRPGYRSFLGAAPEISRLIMGSGGGGGDANDAITGTKGGVGGAIILIRANTISGTGTIHADGGAGAPGVFGGLPDGAGGGGAGGTVLLNVAAPSPGANITISAKGGDGGNTEGDGNPDPNSNVSAHGPGGGGGGGIVWYRFSGGTVNASAAPGLAGRTNNGDAGSTPHGADTGTAGIVRTFTSADLPLYLQGGGGTGDCVQEPPVAINDSATTTLNTPVTIPVLVNDTAKANPLDSAGIVIVDQPQYGAVTIDSAGNIIYTPDSAFTGKDTLQYIVRDTAGIPSDTAYVIITINPPSTDQDNDGVPDLTDPDDDNDGIPDTTEAGPDPNNPVDKDNDGIPDVHDLDSDNDGIPDIIEAGGTDPDNDGRGDTTDVDNDGLPDEFDPDQGGALQPVPDTDNDGTPDVQDLDADNDGIPDVKEAGLPDTDNNGIVDGPDANGDGWSDPVDGLPALTLPDADADGKPDYLDIDADNDGIVDNVESQPTTGYIPPTGTDTDSDGLDNAYDPTTGPGGPGITPVNTDTLDVPDYLDTDTDNDGKPDILEGWDTNGNGVVDGAEKQPGTADADNDGLLDGFDADTTAINPTNGTTPASYPDVNVPGNDRDWREPVVNPDRDNDGVPDNTDLDDDNDGIPDTTELGPDPNNPKDTDGDGIPDNHDLDSDNDGIPDIIEAGGTDPDGNGMGDTTDADNDGLPDEFDPDQGGTVQPTPDTDNDGIPDYLDIDADNDGIVDNIEGQPTSTYKAPTGTDSDGDGIDNAYDPVNGFGGPGITPVNTSGADNPDYTDLDSDDDGKPDRLEGWDTNGNGVIDGAEKQPGTVDADKDGLLDGYDADPAKTNPTNGTTPASYPDMNTPGNDRDWRELIAGPDNDGDGITDATDADDDNDGVPDTTELGPNPNNPVDTDGDGIPDHKDLDSDNDGVPDIIENGGTDTNGDGLADDPVDKDKNGLPDKYDPAQGGTPLTPPDRDQDGVPDARDLDSDNDGIPDIVEMGGTDANNDGKPDGPFTDADKDGFIDSIDPANNTPTGGTPLVITGPDGNADGKPDNYPGGDDQDRDGVPNLWDIDSDNDGITDVKEAGLPDTDNNGQADGPDADGNGWKDPVDNLPALNVPNSDGSGKPDYLDLDADDDGIVDNIEGQGTTAYIPPTGMDTDGDGLDNAYDPTNGPGGAGLTPVNTENTDKPDYTDTDADNDGKPDRLEGWDTNGNGVIDGAEKQPGTADADNDGLLDGYDANPARPDPTNGTTPGSYPDVNNPGNDRDWREKQGPVADLEVTITLQTTDAVRTGDFITYTVTVVNKGPQNATGVVVSNILPSMLNAPREILVPKGTAAYDPVTHTITWNMDGLLLDETQVMTFSTRVLSNGSLTDSAVVRGNETDPVMVNNEDIAPAVTITGEELFIPNTFTPNNDGRNDRFVIKGLARYTNIRLEVYNRWGNQVYRSDNYSNNWDGAGLSQGIYYYVLKVREAAGIEREYQGWIQLLR